MKTKQNFYLKNLILIFLFLFIGCNLDSKRNTIQASNNDTLSFVREKESDKWTLFKIHAPNQEKEHQIRDSLTFISIRINRDTVIINDIYKAPIRFYKMPLKNLFRHESSKEFYQYIFKTEYNIELKDEDTLEYFEIDSAIVTYPFNELMMEGNMAIKIGSYLFFNYMFEPISFKKED